MILSRNRPTGRQANKRRQIKGVTERPKQKETDNEEEGG